MAQTQGFLALSSRYWALTSLQPLITYFSAVQYHTSGKYVINSGPIQIRVQTFYHLFWPLFLSPREASYIHLLCSTVFYNIILYNRIYMVMVAQYIIEFTFLEPLKNLYATTNLHVSTLVCTCFCSRNTSLEMWLKLSQLSS